jgi:hypothetical protein
MLLSAEEIYASADEIKKATAEILRICGSSPRIVPNDDTMGLNTVLCAMFTAKGDFDQAAYYLSQCKEIMKILSSFPKDAEGDLTESFTGAMVHLLVLQSKLDESIEQTPEPFQASYRELKALVPSHPLTTEDLSGLHPLIALTLSKIKTDIDNPKKLELIAEVFKQGLQLVVTDPFAASLLAQPIEVIFIHDRVGRHRGFSVHDIGVTIDISTLFQENISLTSSMQQFTSLLIHEIAHNALHSRHHSPLPYDTKDAKSAEAWNGIKYHIQNLWALCLQILCSAILKQNILNQHICQKYRLMLRRQGYLNYRAMSAVLL